MALSVTALAVLFTVACGSLPAAWCHVHPPQTSGASWGITINVVYPAGSDPYPICTQHCPCQEEVWFDGVAYKHFSELERYNMMVELTFKKGGFQGCKMVIFRTREQLRERQKPRADFLDHPIEQSSNSITVELEQVPEYLSGFTRVGNSSYLIAPRALTWQDGANFCRLFDATPAIIESPEEQALLQGMLTSDVWIGLNDVAVEGSFVNPGRSAVKYTNWAVEQPNNGCGRDEDCTMMVESLDFSWIDASCDVRKRVLCELSSGPVEGDLVIPTLAPPPTTTTRRVYRYSCPTGSHKFNNSACFHVSRPAVKGTYQQAINYCAARHMTLASIHSQAEQNFIRGLLKDSVWIGLHDRTREGHLEWIDGTPLDYRYFAAGQPLPLPIFAAEDCVEIRKAFGFFWNDWTCNNKLQFLCRTAVLVE